LQPGLDGTMAGDNGFDPLGLSNVSYISRHSTVAPRIIIIHNHMCVCTCMDVGVREKCNPHPILSPKHSLSMIFVVLQIDPLKLPQVIPPAHIGAPSSPLSTLYWMRESELKHGRIAMLALVGFASVDLGFHFPGAQYEGLTSVTAHNAMVGFGNMGFLLLVASFLEIVTMPVLAQVSLLLSHC
jgi:hypothetical protein